MLTFMIDGYLAESRYSWQLRRTTAAAAIRTFISAMSPVGWWRPSLWACYRQCPIDDASRLVRLVSLHLEVHQQVHFSMEQVLC